MSITTRPTPEQYGASEGWRLLDPDEQGGSFSSVIVQGLELLNTDGRWSANSYTGSDSPTMSVYRTKMSRAELRAARRLPPECDPVKAAPPVWIRAGERRPQPEDFPILIKGSGDITVMEKAPDGYPPVRNWLWAPLTLPLMPAPTQQERDDKAFEAYITTCHAKSSIIDLRHAWDAGIQRGRMVPVS